MSLQILRNVARTAALQSNLVASGLPNTGTAMYAMMLRRSPSHASNGYYWRADTAVWQATLPIFSAEWISATHEAFGRWSVLVPAAATSGLAIGDAIEIWLADNATPASRTTYSESVDAQIVATFAASTGSGAVTHTLRVRNGTLAGDPPPPGAVTLFLYDSANLTLLAGPFTTDGSGDVALAVVAGSYTARPLVSGGWRPTSASTAFTASDGGSTVIPGTAVTIPAASAGHATVQFEVREDGTARSGVVIRVALAPGQRFPAGSSSRDTVASTAWVEKTTNASGIATVQVPQGAIFVVDAPALGETGDVLYQLLPGDTAVNFASLSRRERR